MESTVIVFVVLNLGRIGALTFKEEDSRCGTISYIDPVTNTRPVFFKFSPKPPVNGTVAKWNAYYIPDDTDVLLDNNTDMVATYETEGVFYLELREWKVSHYEDYYVRYGQCETHYVSIKETDLRECGLLHVQPEKPVNGTLAQLLYYPAKTVLSSLSTVNWIFLAKICQTQCLPENISNKYKQTTNTPYAEYILDIPNINNASDGVYYIQCSDGTTTNNVTVDVIVLEPPSQPVISRLVEINGTEYIVGRENQVLNMACTTTGGTKPVTVNITLSNIDLDKSTSHSGDFKPTNYKPIQEFHMQNLTCTVNNAALKKPLKAVAKLYMIQTPVYIDIQTTEVVQYEPIGINCTVSVVRPPPKLFMEIDGDIVMDTHQIDTFDEHTKLYNSTIHLQTMKRKWNGKPIRCCASHDLYGLPPKCSAEKQLSYKFRWESFSLLVPKYIKELRPYYLINVTCDVDNSNPVAKTKWKGKQELFIDKIKEPKITTADSGTTECIKAILNVSAEHNGEQIRCETSSPEFGTYKLLYEIRVPALPNVTINTTSPFINVTVGESLVLECFVKSEPKSDISWGFGGRNETEFRTFTCGDQARCLAIDYAYLRHQGSYTCQAINRHGTSNRTIELSVKENQVDGSKSSPMHMTLVTGFVTTFVVIGVMAVVVIIVVRRIKSKTADTVTTTDTDDVTTTKLEKSLPPHVSFKTPDADVIEYPYSSTGSQVITTGILPEITSQHPPNDSAPTELMPSSSAFITGVGVVSDTEHDNTRGNVNEGFVVDDRGSDTSTSIKEGIQVIPFPPEDPSSFEDGELETVLSSP